MIAFVSNRRRAAVVTAMFATTIALTALAPMTNANAAATSRPQVLKLSVTHGSTKGGTRVVLTGRHFAHLRSVRFGLVAARIVGTHTATRVVVISPKHAAGLVDLRVVTRAGTSARTTADRFRFVVPLRVSTSILPGAVAGSVYAKALSATGGFGARTWSAGGLPAGVTITPGGSLSGIPAAAGTSQVALHVRDKLGDVASRTLALVVTPATSGPPPPLLPALPGSYTGVNPQNNFVLTLYVANSGTSLQDVSIAQVSFGCAGNTAIAEPFSVPTIPLAADGSFSATVVTTGQVFGNPATFTSVFSGFFHGNSAAPPFSGTFRESVTYTDTVVHTCTSNDQNFTVTRQVQPTQTADPPPPGSYTGVNPQNNFTLTLYVSNARTSLQDVSIAQVSLGCPGNTAIGEPFSVPTIPLAADGSFSATVVTTGQVLGNPATFTSVFNGNVHSLNPDGVERAAGTFSESVTYTDTADHTCTSNEQNFTVTRQVQPAQTADPPPPGSYTGVNPQNNFTLTFTVAPDATSLQNVSIAQVSLGCPGNTALGEPFSVATVPVAADGSFTATVVTTGQVLGNPATFTSVFNGNFHSLNPNGVERAAGTFSESVAFTDTAPRSCTTNDQNFTVAHS